ncbi:MAG: MarR family winged helix-turn-helix transcriptional regulator [Thiolinea sp.]
MTPKPTEHYTLEDQIGHILRKANQRHTGIFSNVMPVHLTPTRFAAMAKLLECGALSQNALGRLTAMDIATIKGVVDRLRQRGLVESNKDPNDARRQLITLTEQGMETIRIAIPEAVKVTEQTVDALSEDETAELLRLLKKIS